MWMTNIDDFLELFIQKQTYRCLYLLLLITFYRFSWDERTVAYIDVCEDILYYIFLLFSETILYLIILFFSGNAANSLLLYVTSKILLNLKSFQNN